MYLKLKKKITKLLETIHLPVSGVVPSCFALCQAEPLFMQALHVTGTYPKS